MVGVRHDLASFRRRYGILLPLSYAIPATDLPLSYAISASDIPPPEPSPLLTYPRPMRCLLLNYAISATDLPPSYAIPGTHIPHPPDRLYRYRAHDPGLQARLAEINCDSLQFAHILCHDAAFLHLIWGDGGVYQFAHILYQNAAFLRLIWGRGGCIMVHFFRTMRC